MHEPEMFHRLLYYSPFLLMSVCTALYCWIAFTHFRLDVYPKTAEGSVIKTITINHYLPITIVITHRRNLRQSLTESTNRGHTAPSWS